MADKVLTTASGKQVPLSTVGVPGYQSSALLPSGQGTVDGDKFNQFRGYTGPQGGGFGGFEGTAAPSVMDRVNDPMGDLTSADDPALSDKVRRGQIAQGILKEDGSLGQKILDDPAYQAEQARQAGTAGAPDDSALDLYGRNDAATSNRPVLKASDTFDTLRQQARRMATPQLLPQSATVPNTGTQPANPFDQFNAAQAPASQSQAMTPAVGTGFMENNTLDFAPPADAGPIEQAEGVKILPGGVRPAGPVELPTEGVKLLPGGVKTVPSGPIDLGGDDEYRPLSKMTPPAAGGIGGVSSAPGRVASGSSFGGAPGGLRKIGAKQRNPMMPDSRQNSGLFSGLRKIGQQKKPVQSPTGGSPMAPNLSAY